MGPPSWAVLGAEGTGCVPRAVASAGRSQRCLCYRSLGLVPAFRWAGGKDGGQKTPKLPPVGRDRAAAEGSGSTIAWHLCLGLACWVSFRSGQKIQLFPSTRRQGMQTAGMTVKLKLLRPLVFLCLGENTWKHVNSIKYLKLSLSILSSKSPLPASRLSIIFPTPSRSLFRVALMWRCGF